MEHQGSWDKNLSWAEFSYNNSYQESLRMASFEILYGRRCCTPLNWIEPGEKMISGPDLNKEVEATVSRSHSRQLKSHKVTPRKLCKQEVSTLEV
jgi:hypothetical protein